MSELQSNSNRVEQLVADINTSINQLGMKRLILYANQTTVQGNSKAQNTADLCENITEGFISAMLIDIENLHSVAIKFETLDLNLAKNLSILGK